MTEIDDDFCRGFSGKPALSFSSQPNLKQLFKTLADDKERFTIVVGAGASLDAGLPSWPGLINNITDEVDEQWRSEVRLDETDLMRKAEYLVQLADESYATAPAGVIQKALYPKSSGATARRVPVPGRLADAVARLCLALVDRVDIVTTNFDILLESAIGDYARPPAPPSSVPFDQRNWNDPEWDMKWSKGRGVLHLHGIIHPSGATNAAVGDLVLTETDFLRYGPEIKAFMLQRCRYTNVVFVGVSLTDPNLVAPLWELKKEYPDGPPKTCFILSVANPNPRSSAPGVSGVFAIKKTAYLQRQLGVTPIFFKSYAQQIQALCEASLAIIYGKGYLNNRSGTSSRYGFRLRRALNTSYANIGCVGKEVMPKGDRANSLSDRLSQALKPNSAARKAIATARQRTQLRVSHQKYAQYQSDFDHERWGIFLWLRPRSAGDPDSYSLRCVGTSVHRDRDEWRFDMESDISAAARLAVGRVAFRGQSELSDLLINEDWQLWGAVMAVPFSFYEEDALKAIDIGVIALHSTNFCTEHDGMKWSERRPRSILSALSDQESGALSKALSDFARNIVTTRAAP